MKRVCLNMIVRNEAAIIERCLASFAGQIDYWVIADTGSTDGTPERISAFFAGLGIPGEIHHRAFVNFSQARNEALRLARESAGAFDYILLCDADMELRVEDLTWREHLEHPVYLVRQRNQISYWNTRLIARSEPAEYIGATHEYVSAPSAPQRFEGIRFDDHADGSSRPEKYARDIRLLGEAVQLKPDDARSWFYLAQTYRDAGRYADACAAYQTRAALGGWEEEVWCSHLQFARCKLALGEEDAFVAAALRAYNTRPTRAEPLYELAKFYRQRGMNEAAMLACEQAERIPYPKADLLFVEDAAYLHGIREEISICGFYCRDAARRAAGARAADALSLSPEAPAATRDLARRNLAHYARPLAELAPFVPVEVSVDAPWASMNPSLAYFKGRRHVLVRTVNYRLLPKGYYEIFDPNRTVRTRNYLIREGEPPLEVHLPRDLPDPAYKHVLGFEDMRLFEWNGGLWCSSTVRQLNPRGVCEIVLARIGDDGVLADWRALPSPIAGRHEKNWMPAVLDGELHFVYSTGPTVIIDASGRVVHHREPPLALDHLRGGTQLVPALGGWLALVHESVLMPEGRRYLHRFAAFKQDGAPAHLVLSALSRPFYFMRQAVEFAAGLAIDPNGDLEIAFGVEDAKAYTATVRQADVAAMLSPLDDFGRT